MIDELHWNLIEYHTKIYIFAYLAVIILNFILAPTNSYNFIKTIALTNISDISNEEALLQYYSLLQCVIRNKMWVESEFYL